jgi:uncharacterized protein
MPATLDELRPLPRGAGKMKVRAGGVLSRGEGKLTVHEQRLLDGDVRAMRALLRQACGVNTLDLQLKETELRWVPNGTGGTRAVFTGMFSKLDTPFTMADQWGTYDETMRSGSLTRTISLGCDTQFCLNHDWTGAPMARTVAGSLDLTPDATCEARIDPARSDVAIVASAIEGGELNAMSFAFWATRQEWDGDYTTRDILECDMDGGDVSVVTFPANPGTTGSVGLQRQQARSLLRTRVPALIAERVRGERRAGKTLSSATMDVLNQVLDLVAQADTAVDQAQPLLADLMGVANPDDAQDAQTSDDDTDAGDDSDSRSRRHAARRAAQRARLRRELAH